MSVFIEVRKEDLKGKDPTQYVMMKVADVKGMKAREDRMISLMEDLQDTIGRLDGKADKTQTVISTWRNATVKLKRIDPQIAHCSRANDAESTNQFVEQQASTSAPQSPVRSLSSASTPSSDSDSSAEGTEEVPLVPLRGFPLPNVRPTKRPASYADYPEEPPRKKGPGKKKTRKRQTVVARGSDDSSGSEPRFPGPRRSSRSAGRTDTKTKSTASRGGKQKRQTQMGKEIKQKTTKASIANVIKQREDRRAESETKTVESDVPVDEYTVMPADPQAVSKENTPGHTTPVADSNEVKEGADQLFTTGNSQDDVPKNDDETANNQEMKGTASNDGNQQPVETEHPAQASDTSQVQIDIAHSVLKTKLPLKRRGAGFNRTKAQQAAAKMIRRATNRQATAPRRRSQRSVPDTDKTTSDASTNRRNPTKSSPTKANRSPKQQPLRHQTPVKEGVVLWWEFLPPGGLKVNKVKAVKKMRELIAGLWEPGASLLELCGDVEEPSHAFQNVFSMLISHVAYGEIGLVNTNGRVFLRGKYNHEHDDRTMDEFISDVPEPVRTAVKVACDCMFVPEIAEPQRFSVVQVGVKDVSMTIQCYPQ